METPPVESSLAFTLSWNSAGKRRQASVSFGAALRVALVLSLCAGCYEVGAWRARLEALGEPKPDSRVIVVQREDKAIRNESTGMAPGGAIGEKDVITPLNVRDPSALVMGPGATENPPAPPPAVAPPAASPETEKQIPDVSPPAKKYKRAKDIKPNQRF
ncbi:MAG: hypothetical protein ACHQ51_11580 [Elusimicrobiota bacterium]